MITTLCTAFTSYLPSQQFFNAPTTSVVTLWFIPDRTCMTTIDITNDSCDIARSRWWAFDADSLVRSWQEVRNRTTGSNSSTKQQIALWRSTQRVSLGLTRRFCFVCTADSPIALVSMTVRIAEACMNLTISPMVAWAFLIADTEQPEDSTKHVASTMNVYGMWIFLHVCLNAVESSSYRCSAIVALTNQKRNVVSSSISCGKFEIITWTSSGGPGGPGGGRDVSGPAALSSKAGAATGRRWTRRGPLRGALGLHLVVVSARLSGRRVTELVVIWLIPAPRGNRYAPARTIRNSGQLLEESRQNLL